MEAFWRFCPLAIVLSLSALTATAVAAAAASSEEIRLTFISGSTRILACRSSYPPPWTKIGRSNGDVTIIGVNGEKHAGWTDSRYEFLREDQNYSIRISDVRPRDAGKFICGSEPAVAFIVTVVR